MTDEVTVSIRPLQIEDRAILLSWLSNQTLLEYYGGRDINYTLDKISEHFFPEDDTEYRFIVLLNDRAIGYVQFYELDEESKLKYGYEQQNATTIFGMDQFIGEPLLWNKGIGVLLVKHVIQHIRQHFAVDLIVMDPQARNSRSIKCYEKCGFSKVKLMPKHEWHEGIFEDCYLMEYKV